MYTKKQTLIKKTMQVGGSTLSSRLLGLIRELLMARYLGAGPIAEAFITAFKIPNSLRKIFAEGALSVAFIPTLVTLVNKKGKSDVNRLMSLALLLFEGFLAIFCLLVIWKAHTVMRLIVPGWFTAQQPSVTFDAPFGTIINSFYSFWLSLTGTYQPSEHVVFAVLFLRILMGLILFLSTSALLAGVLNAVNHFFIPAFAPVLLNIIFIGGLLICIALKLSPVYLCLFIMFGAFVQLVLHVMGYLSLGFGLGRITGTTWQQFKQVWHKFLPCLFSMSVMEIYVFIDTSFGSYFPGAIATLYYANRFMQIPLGVIATALSTILLPYFSHVATYAPKRLSFYLLEAAKLITWLMTPITLLMSFASYEIFLTLFLSHKFPLVAVKQASNMFIIFLSGLIFFSLNKILLNIYYGLHETKIPMYISIIATISNVGFSYIFMHIWGPYGIAAATTLCGILQTALFILWLPKRFDFVYYGYAFFTFFCSFLAQLVCAIALFLLLYKIIIGILHAWAAPYVFFLTQQIGFWLWYIPLASCMICFLFLTKNLFSIRLYFLDS